MKLFGSGQRGRGWLPRRRRSVDELARTDIPEPAPGLPDDVPPSAVLEAGPGIVGQAHRIQSRTEAYGQGATRTILTFRVERYDSAGNQILLVPVQMKGIAFEGAVSEGDWVRVQGSRRGGTLSTRRLENLSTGAVVVAEGFPWWMWVLAAITGALVLAIMAFVIANMLGLFDGTRLPWENFGPPSDFPTFPPGFGP